MVPLGSSIKLPTICIDYVEICRGDTLIGSFSKSNCLIHGNNEIRGVAFQHGSSLMPNVFSWAM